MVAGSVQLLLALAVALCFLTHPLNAGESVPRKGRGIGSELFGHDFWRQFEHGFRHIEESARQDAAKLEGMFDSWLSPSGRKNQHKSDVELIKPSPTRDTESVEVDDDFDVGEAEVDDVSDDFPGSFFNLFGDVASTRTWWSGPNVCVDREEIDEGQKTHNDTESDDSEGDSGIHGSFQFSSCRQTDTKYTCTTKIRSHGIRKTFVVTYKCCHGFRRIPGKPGCTEVNLKPMLETLADVGARDFAELVRSTGLEEKVTADNLTVFAPSDEAVRDFSDSMQSVNQVEFYLPPARSRRDIDNELAPGGSMREVLLGHMVPGMHDIGELVDEQVLYSDNNNATLRYNVYPAPGERLLTVNCARITSVNIYAQNGIVHVVDRVLRPVEKTLAQLIENDSQFTKLRELLERTGQLDKLSEPGHLTLFAPVDSAFDKLDSAVRDRLLASGSDSCLKSVLGHHLLTHSLCSCAVTRRLITHSSVGTPLLLERSDDGKLFVGDGNVNVQIVARDIMGTNGIVHVVEEVMLPDSGLPVTTVLERQNLTTFTNLIREANLLESLDAASNVTVFAPTDEALRRPEAMAVVQSAREDPERLRQLVMYHVSRPELHSCDITNNKMIESGVDGLQLRINLYATVPHFSMLGKRATVQCARIVDLDEHACGGLIHQVDRLLLPPAGNADQLLQANGNFSTFRRLLQEANMMAELKESSPFTLLAPTDDAFARIPQQELEELIADKENLAKVLRKHILPEVLCCSGVSVATWPFSSRAESLAGPLNLRRDYEGRVHVGGAAITSCDHATTDGVVHIVNKFMLPSNPKFRRVIGHRSRNPNVEVFLYGL